MFNNRNLISKIRFWVKNVIFSENLEYKFENKILFEILFKKLNFVQKIQINAQKLLFDSNNSNFVQKFSKIENKVRKIKIIYKNFKSLTLIED